MSITQILITFFVLVIVIALFLPKFRERMKEFELLYDAENFDNPLNSKEDKIDKLYSKLYDAVFNEPNVYIQEAKTIIDFMNKHEVPKKKKTPTNFVLECGTGSGKHYQYLATATNFSIMGLERSKTMEEIFKLRNPLGKITIGDMRNENLFGAETFSYIICLKETLYHNPISDWDAVLSNFFYWLKPGGYLIIHVYDREKLDPAPRNMSFIRKDANGRKHAITQFPNFTHDGWWEVKGKVICQYNEIFAIRGKNSEIEKKRHYKHNLVIPPKDKIMEKIIGNYFKLINIVKMENIGLVDHELCFFKKNKF